jgi:transglutaminase-like putative cysteine protease
VKNNIKFGFTKKIDLPTNEETLDFKIGHCNPKASLFKEMLRMVGIQSRLHFFTLKSDILYGFFTSK